MRNLLAPVFGLLLVGAVHADTDEYAQYREQIDNYQAHNSMERDRVIQELENKPSSDVERDYLLGMLNYLQIRDAMRLFAKKSKTKPTIAEAARDPVASGYIRQAKHYYDEVEQRSPGYKYIYCKYGELYRDTYDIEGLRATVTKMGRAHPNKRLTECKKMLENTAVQYAQYNSPQGDAVVQAIFEEMTLSWPEYPKYILEPLGDIAQFQNDVPTNRKSYYWWDRCAHEVEDGEIKQRCLDKLTMLKQKGAARP